MDLDSELNIFCLKIKLYIDDNKQRHVVLFYYKKI